MNSAWGFAKSQKDYLLLIPLIYHGRNCAGVGIVQDGLFAFDFDLEFE